MSAKEDNGKESKEPDYDEDKNQLEEKQEDEKKLNRGNNKSSFLNSEQLTRFALILSFRVKSKRM